jgi:hypothetical protein
MSKTQKLRLRALAVTGLGVAFAAPAVYGDFVITPVVGSISGGDVDYVLTVLNNGLDGTGSVIKAFDLTVTTPGSGTNGALVIDLSADINGDGAIDANVGAQPDIGLEAPAPTFGSDLGTFLGLGSGPLVQPISPSSEPGILTVPTTVKVNGATADYLSSKGSSSALSSAFTTDTVHSLEVSSSLATGVLANVSPIPFANIVVPSGTQFSFTGSLTGGGGNPVIVSSPQSAATGPVISLTGSVPSNSNSIASITLMGANGLYAYQSVMVSGSAAQSTGFVTVHGFSPTSNKEIYALALDVDGTFLPQTSPVLSAIISDLNTALGSSGTASLITPAMAGMFPTSTYDAMITFPGGPTPSTAAPAIFSYDFSGYTANGDVTVTQIGVVPEPVSGALILGGLGLLARRRRRSVAA